MLVLAGTVLLAMSLAAPVSAQDLTEYPYAGSSVKLDILKAHFNHGDMIDFLTSVIYCTGTFAISDNSSIVIELPIANADVDPNTQYYSNETQFGSPYAGFQARIPSPGGSGLGVTRLGIRLPLASDEKLLASDLALYTDYDRLQAYYPDFITLSGSGGYLNTGHDYVHFGFNIGAAYMIPTEDGPDSELFIDYNFYVWMLYDKVHFGTGFTGKMLATESGLSFGERTVHQMVFKASYVAGNIRPGVYFRIPLDDTLSDALDYVYGLNVAFVI